MEIKKGTIKDVQTYAKEGFLFKEVTLQDDTVIRDWVEIKKLKEHALLFALLAPGDEVEYCFHGKRYHIVFCSLKGDKSIPRVTSFTYCGVSYKVSLQNGKGTLDCQI